MKEDVPSLMVRPTVGQLIGGTVATTIGQTLLLALVVGVAAYFSVGLTRVDGGVSVVWVANGILTGVLLLTPRASWPRWLIAAGLAQCAARGLLANPLDMIVGLTAANLLESWLVAFCVRSRTEDLRDLGSLPEVSRTAILSTLVATALSAFVPVLVAPLRTPPLETWFTWFAAHLLGMVVMATLTVCALQPKVHLLGRPGRRADYFACIVLLLLTCVAIFWQDMFPLLFLSYLPLMLLTFRHGLAGMVVGVLVLAVVSGVAAARGTGPFGLTREHSTLAHLLLWQVYVASSCMLAYPAAIAMAERRRLLTSLRASQARVNLIADNVPASIAYIDANERYVYANAAARRTSENGEDPVGRHLREVRGAAIHALVADHVAAVMRGERQDFEMQAMINGFRRDVHAHFVPDVGPDGRVAGYFSMAQDVTAAKENERELVRLARFDALTGLANRRHFEESLAAAVVRAPRLHAPLMLLSLDIDHFKQINDTYGHAVGDEVLRQFARRLGNAVYDVDLAARMGGDEFVVLVEYSPTAEVGRMVAARVIEAMMMPIFAGDVALPIGVSIGIGVHHPVQSAEQLVALADKALYAAKARGRNTWAVAEG
jgi:diguanylate cyclase (GGDEF)-like protein/PAS domain S-box-containing protein